MDSYQFGTFCYTKNQGLLMLSVTFGNIRISPEYHLQKGAHVAGHVDFIPGVKWGIENHCSAQGRPRQI